MIEQVSQILPPMTTPFAIAALLIELTPGPNMTYLALLSASDGRRAGFAAVSGIALGLALIGLAAALGVAELVQRWGILYEVLRWSGVAFLLYLAWEGWAIGTDVVADAQAERGRNFTRGLITNLLNPKAALFYVAILPTFIDPALPPARQAIVLTIIYLAVATLVHVLIVLLAGSLEQFLNHSGRERIVRRSLSFLLGVVAIWFAWTTTR